MAKIKEFKGLMYDSDIVGDLSSVVAPHCHAIEEDLIKKMYSAHPFNVIRLEYPLADESKPGDKYIQVADMLENWLETGIVKYDDSECLYIYEQEYSFRDKIECSRGIICLVKIEEYENSIVIPHENANTNLYDEYKSDRYNLMKATGAEFSNIYSLYEDEDKKIEELLKTDTAPDIEFTDDYGTVQRIWRISNKEKINKIKELFDNKKLIIADGHIRYETAATYCRKMKNEVVEYTGDEPFNYIMMNIEPVSEILPRINPVHRLVKNKQNFDEEKIIEALSEKFNIEKSYIREYDCKKIETRLAENKDFRALGMYTGKDYYYIILPKNPDDYSEMGDAEILHREILGKFMGINKDNIKQYIEYAATIREAEESVRENVSNCAFYLNPMSARKMTEFAKKGICMPKRTNCFYPKLMMGIVMNKFDE
ncbi:MAG: DUF1015 domain-containing protein [Bacillota bacterium]|nr:DUF1015 domain-containing protein [Bacillota bacterium]